jgi:hypothetical protein
VPISRRYTPEFAPGETCSIGLDYSFIIPLGVGIASGSLTIFTNTADPQPADGDFQIGAVSVRDRAIYATLSGGVRGRDYQLQWTAVDTDGNTWPRTCLMLCAPTS